MNLGMKLRILRSERTLANVAQAINGSLSFLSDVERGRAMPSLETVQKLADFYGVTLAELFRDVRIDGQRLATTWKQEAQ